MSGAPGPQAPISTATVWRIVGVYSSHKNGRLRRRHLAAGRAEEFPQEKCKAAGVRMDAVVYPGEGHSFFGLRRSLSRFLDTTIEMDKFLASLGWLTGPPTLTKDDVQAYAAEAVQNTKDKKPN